MKKLRATTEEKEKLIVDITERLAYHTHGSIEDFDIKDLLKEYTKLPNHVQKPIINISAETYLKMLELINQSPVECSWHGLVRRAGNEYFIYDVLVFPQINSGASTTTDEKEFAEWQTKLIMDPEFPIEDLRMHGHSHVLMNVFSSGVDDQYQKDLITKVEDGDYYIFLIMNKKMEMCIFIYDFEQQIMFETSDITVKINYGNTDIRKWAKDQLEEKATTERTLPRKSPLSYYSEEEDYGYSYFSNSKPVFKGVKHGFK